MASSCSECPVEVYPVVSRLVRPRDTANIIIEIWELLRWPACLARLACITMAPDSSLTRMKIMLVYIYNFTPALLRPPPTPLLEFCNSTKYIDNYNTMAYEKWTHWESFKTLKSHLNIHLKMDAYPQNRLHRKAVSGWDTVTVLNKVDTTNRCEALKEVMSLNYV